MMAADYRHIGGRENRLGRHYSRFSPFWPTPALAGQSLALRKLCDAGSNRRSQAKAAEPSLLAGLLVDARGERLTPSHAVKKGRRCRYYVSAALLTDAGTDREGWRLAAREIEEAVIRILADALTSPVSLVERFG